MLTHLLLMRHAQASAPHQAQNDHERPLSQSGLKEAQLIGQTLKVRGYAPDLIWSSDAKRTKETALELIRTIPGAQRVFYDERFYHASASTALDIAFEMGEPDDSSILMWLGHNPGWAELFSYFTNKDMDVPAGSCLVLKRRTGAQTDWLAAPTWSVIDKLNPSDLAA